MGYLNPEQSPKKRQHRADIAADQHTAASRLAIENGLVLRSPTPIHYQLFPKDRSWLLNIYPSNRRLYHDKNKRGPFLKVPEDWNLIDVVRAAGVHRQ